MLTRFYYWSLYNLLLSITYQSQISGKICRDSWLEIVYLALFYYWPVMNLFYVTGVSCPTPYIYGYPEGGYVFTKNHSNMYVRNIYEKNIYKICTKIRKNKNFHKICIFEFEQYSAFFMIRFLWTKKIVSPHRWNVYKILIFLEKYVNENYLKI